MSADAGGADVRGALSWRGFALPGVVWLVPVHGRPGVRGAGDGVRPGELPARAGAGVEPGHVERRLPLPGDLGRACPGGEFWPSVRNTIVYVAASLVLCFAIGYPVAYYVARHARRTKALLIVLLVIPFWVSYLLRMLAWIGLLASDGYVNKVLSGHRHRAPAGLAQRQRLLGDPRARLRLHPVLHPARVRGPRPHRPPPDRGGARPRRDAVPRLPARDAAAQPARRCSRAARSSCCRCSATTTPTT